jgi:NAD-dependent deacetylase
VPKEPWREAELAALASDVFLVIGTSAVVLPASQIISHARYAGAKIIEINPEETWVSDKVDCSLRGAAGEILPGLAA